MTTVYLATQITARLATALAGITVANGSQTDIGTNVIVNDERTNDTAAPCVVLLEGDEAAAPKQAGLILTAITYTVSAYVNRKNTTIPDYVPDPTAEWVIIGALLCDIRTALESRWCSLGQYRAEIEFVAARKNLSQDGGDLIGVEARYTVTFGAVHGDFKNPNA